MSQVIKLKESFKGEELNLKLSVNIGTQIKKEHLIEDELGNSKEVYLEFFNIIQTWFGDIKQYQRRLRLIQVNRSKKQSYYPFHEEHYLCGLWVGDCLNNDTKFNNIKKVCDLLGVSCVAY